ncbi:ring-cleaving dioxygenase [Pseudogracilibacillus auburnensis]|uniref:ring-cleaving dioxygenase n=1 Tax=Pseudogracilibacillus auburnensis TaxID=1494959 RepID=UPI001A96E993|nr:ring-cleaving dioxygenase [Pseudogracilibacillus auburnensis]MBO1004691.1 ring-cleaving dioxygenase [Pseudogracilibacillus auburnensis]
MKKLRETTGIHHITAIVGHPQENVDFYAGVLGLRLVKKTVNFDDPGTYHLYFGNANGSPGTIITFFPWNGAKQGAIGNGQVGKTSYAIPPGATLFWKSRLKQYNIAYKEETRFGEQYLSFSDPHGLLLELVEREVGEENEWTNQDITKEEAIKGFAGAVLYSANPDRTIQVLENVMGLKKVGTENEVTRLQSMSTIGNIVDVKKSHEKGVMGVGTVHHIAWRAESDAELIEWQQFVRENRLAVTEVRDRNYFKSIYFKEHGDILFEIATDPPGFSRDEPFETLGSELKLPVQYESNRKLLEKTLIPIKNPNGGGS